MLPNLTAYHKPASIQEAVRLLRRRDRRAVPLAGGTALLAQRDPAIEAVVDLSGLGLDVIRPEATHIEIGAMTTLQTLATAPLLAGLAGGLLATAAHQTATRTIRNTATIGGSIMATGPSTDIVVALLALSAWVDLAEGGDMLLEDFLRRRRRRGELLVGVRVPLTLASCPSGLQRVARLPTDQAVVNVAAVPMCDDGVCIGIRLAAGGVADKPIRLRAAERALLDTRLSEADVAAAIARQQKEIRPPSDILGSSAYRRAMLGVLLQRTIAQCQAKGVA